MVKKDAGSDEKQQKYLRGMQAAANIYSKTYPKLFEDDSSALFQVYT